MDGVTKEAHCLFSLKNEPTIQNCLQKCYFQERDWKLSFVVFTPSDFQFSNMFANMPQMGFWKYGNAWRLNWLHTSRHTFEIDLHDKVFSKFANEYWQCPNDAHRWFSAHPCYLFLSFFYFFLSFWPQMLGNASSTHLVAGPSFTAAIIFLDSISVFWGFFFLICEKCMAMPLLPI